MATKTINFQHVEKMQMFDFQISCSNARFTYEEQRIVKKRKNWYSLYKTEVMEEDGWYYRDFFTNEYIKVKDINSKLDWYETIIDSVIWIKPCIKIHFVSGTVETIYRDSLSEIQKLEKELQIAFQEKQTKEIYLNF
jgi:hypothetical protein